MTMYVLFFMMVLIGTLAKEHRPKLPHVDDVTLHLPVEYREELEKHHWIYGHLWDSGLENLVLKTFNWSDPLDKVFISYDVYSTYYMFGSNGSNIDDAIKKVPKEFWEKIGELTRRRFLKKFGCNLKKFPTDDGYYCYENFMHDPDYRPDPTAAIDDA
ncbi:hypothetical protein DICVIV_13878 [Dictyocaulus viviparus]|uniref:Uncharacterized protein n=1 Tax=Dictyocaulus viviparus TaxID=29172 RepID=A0A0D8X9A5_DICVI|nr:hypothetical protein DICVIV_13878 [Dictyocaulus viviparus]